MTIPKEIKNIIEKLADAGFEAYIVGGCVRGFLLDAEPKDWDVTTNAKPEEIQKSMQGLIALRKAELQAIELRKSAAAIPAIAKALHKPKFKMNAIASHNLKDNAKQAVSMQHKIVSDVMAKMEMEEKRTTTDISKLLEIEGLTKK